MNEVIFFLHILLVVILSFGALRIGKEALIAFVALQAVIANLFVVKQIFFFGWNITCSDVFAVGSILSLNLLQEHFGKEIARRAVWICFFSMIFFGLMAQIHLLYTPSPHDTSHPHFSFLLSPTPRLLLASLLSFFLVQQVDVYVFGMLRKKMSRFDWRWRNSLSLFFSQFLDTLLFTFLGLWGLVSSLGSILFVSFAVKVLIILSIASLTSFSKRFVRHEV
jgi:uncharacterized integral membrane protein (TIGR00697 family)